MLKPFANNSPKNRNDFARFLDPQHPLLVRLGQEMIGTLKHSMVVGVLAFEAVQKIEGNANQALVIGRFHDIGKLGGEELYIEARGEVLKERPPISSREHLQKILNHPGKSVRILLQHDFPRHIVMAVLEHHGTTKTRAALHQDLLAILEEKDLRYPGPLPSSKESAMVMFADCVEASFSYLRGSPKKLTRSGIRDQIYRIWSELADMRQFDNSNLTKNDLVMACQVFEERITHLYA